VLIKINKKRQLSLKSWEEYISEDSVKEGNCGYNKKI